MNKDKINFIVENCDNISIYKIIINNDVPYTKNSNGIFVNLSKLSDKNIDLLYTNLKNNCYKNINNERNLILIKYKEILKNKNKDNKKVYKKFENLSETDLQIIEYSKKI
tara:strand:+ start:362 stop:691 length:330 start_codon:yes stop_codon:yes gene_type:complete